MLGSNVARRLAADQTQ